jgi:hypothetical protein
MITFHIIICVKLPKHMILIVPLMVRIFQHSGDRIRPNAEPLITHGKIVEANKRCAKKMVNHHLPSWNGNFGRYIYSTSRPKVASPLH